MNVKYPTATKRINIDWLKITEIYICKLPYFNNNLKCKKIKVACYSLGALACNSQFFYQQKRLKNGKSWVLYYGVARKLHHALGERGVGEFGKFVTRGGERVPKKSFFCVT